MSASVTYTHPWAVPSSYTWGYLHVGAERDILTWKYIHDSPTCSTVVTRSGTSHLPYHIPVSWHTHS